MKHASHSNKTTGNPTGFLLKMIVDRAETLFAQMEGAPDITPAQCRVLLYLESRGGEAVAQRDIERHMCVSHTTVKGLLQRLEDKGLVRTAFDSEDGRVKHAYLTPYYHKRHAAAQDAIDRLDARMLSGFSAAEKKQLGGMLQRVFDNISQTF